MKPSTAVREPQRTEPADVGFKDRLEEAMAPPETPPPSEAMTKEEGATRTEADLDQSNTEDQTLDQPQNAQELLFSLMPQETRKIAVESEKAVFDSIRATTDKAAPEDSEPDRHFIEQAEPDRHYIEHSDEIIADQVPITEAQEIPSFSEMPTRYVHKDIKSDEEDSTPDVESVEVERPAETISAKPAAEQVQSKAHTLDRPVQALDEIKEIAQRPKADLPIGASRVKITLNPEEFGNLTVTIKNFGKSFEADVQSQSEPLNNALHTHRADLVQSVESKGLSLSNFNVSQDSGQQPQQGHGQSHSGTMRQDFELMHLLSDSTPEAPARPAILGSGLINTIA